MTIEYISVTVLAGNLEDAGIAAGVYAERLETRLTEEFPGADIEVDVQWNTSGYSPAPTVLCDENDDELHVRDLVAHVENETYVQCCGDESAWFVRDEEE